MKRQKVVEGLRRVRERMVDPANVVKDPHQLTERGADGHVRRCIVAHCFREGGGASLGGILCDVLDDARLRVGTYSDLTDVLAKGDHLKVIDAAIAAEEAA